MNETNEQLEGRGRISMLPGSVAEACLRISSYLELVDVLDAIASEAQGLTRSAYAAVRLMDQDPGLPELYLRGIGAEEFASLFLVASEEGTGQPDEVHEEGADPEPSEHVSVPLLQARIELEGNIVAHIYSGNPQNGSSFTAEDDELLQMLALHSSSSVAYAAMLRNEQLAKTGLEGLLENAPTGIFIIETGSGELRATNSEGTRLTRGAFERGRPVQEFAELLELRQPDGQTVAIDEHPIARAIEAGQPLLPQHYVVLYPDGQSFPVLISSAPTVTSMGEGPSVAIFIQDVSSIRSRGFIPAELLRAVRNVLRRPLATMKGSTVAALATSTEQDSGETRLLLEMVDEQLNSVRRMVNDLVDIAEIESGSFRLMLQPIDLPGVLEEALSAARANGLEIAVEVEIAPSVQPVLADRNRMVQVLSYLFSAIAASSPDVSAIRLVATPAGPVVRISVAPEGGRSTSESLATLLARSSLFALRESDLEIGRQDLAMAICAGILSAHGDRIWLEGDDKGSESLIAFSLQVASEAEEGGQQDELNISDPLRSASILIVGLRQQVMLQVRDTLAGVGFNASIAGGSEEAEQIAVVDRPSLVLLDITLPQTEGLGLVRRIREILDCPIIFLSGPGGDKDITRAFEMGAYDYISRPYSPAELIGRVNAAIRNQSSAGAGQINTYERGDLVIDYIERRVSVGGQPVRLTATEYKLLCELSLNAGRVLTNSQLLRRVWGAQSSTDTRILRTFIKNLRRKIGDDAQHQVYIFTEPRVGYRMERP